ncbi:MAG TPA: flavin reductase family protein [Thermoleophilaceae bacterium]|nr:flavin reductase family protein [Thermoleophilaceae bacterium]
MDAAQRTFQELVAQLDYPMFIATVATEAERAGCLIGFATQSSIHPPRFLAGISDKNRTFRVARGADSMAIHLVPEHATELAELFGGETGDDVDKFERCEWQPGPGGVPLLDACPNRFVGRILERIDFGDHVGMVLEPTFAEADEESAQLGFHRARRIEPGHEA